MIFSLDSFDFPSSLSFQKTFTTFINNLCPRHASLSCFHRVRGPCSCCSVPPSVRLQPHPRCPIPYRYRTSPYGGERHDHCQPSRGLFCRICSCYRRPNWCCKDEARSCLEHRNRHHQLNFFMPYNAGSRHLLRLHQPRGRMCQTARR